MYINIESKNGYKGIVFISHIVDIVQVPKKSETDRESCIIMTTVETLTHYGSFEALKAEINKNT